MSSSINQGRYSGHKKLKKISTWLSCGFFVVSVLLFWFGLDFLKTEIFPHYFNPSKHVVVQQNPDTKEIYSWKDSAGNVYNNEDPQVRNFTWGTTALLLFIMIFCAYGYSASMSYFRKLILESEPKARENYVPRLQ